MAENKTEKATPKKRDDARKKGQVARSMDARSRAESPRSKRCTSSATGRISSKNAS